MIRLALSMRRPFVAQVGNLLFRRLAVGRTPQPKRDLKFCRALLQPSPVDCIKACGLPIRDTADCQSALRFKLA